MRIIIIFSIGIFGTLSISCEKARVDCLGFYNITNQSGQRTVIHVYKDSTITDSLVIPNNSFYKNKSGNEGQSGMPDFISLADSIKLIFAESPDLVFNKMDTFTLPNIFYLRDYNKTKTSENCSGTNSYEYPIDARFVD